MSPLSADLILHNIGVNISGYKIEAGHRLGKNTDKTTIKFSCRKDCEHTMRVKTDLKDLDATELDLSVCVLIIEDCGMKPRNCGTRKNISLFYC